MTTDVAAIEPPAKYIGLDASCPRGLDEIERLAVLVILTAAHHEADRLAYSARNRPRPLLCRFTRAGRD